MQKNIKIIYLAGFIFSIPIALTSYINSSFLKGFIDASSVSIIYAIGSIITIIGLSQMPKLLNKIGNKRASFIFSILCFLSLLTLAFSQNIVFILPAFILFFVSQNLIIATLDVFVEYFSESENIGKLRGIYLTVLSTAWVISQMISGSIITKSSFKGIYLLGSFFMFLFSIIFIFSLHTFEDPKYKKIPLIKTFINFTKNKNTLKIYIANFVLKFFYVWMIIYTPIYLHEFIGFDWSQIGIIFTIMLLPFVIVTYPLGKLSDKIGEKKMLILGFIISTIATLTIPFIKTTELFLWAGILFTTRIGAATIEIMSESYFFKTERKEDADAIAFFRNTSPFSFIIAPLVATPIILLTPDFSYIFFVLGAILLYGLFVTINLKDVK